MDGSFGSFGGELYPEAPAPVPESPEALAPVFNNGGNTVDGSTVSKLVENAVAKASEVAANGIKNSLAGLNLEEFGGLVGSLSFVAGFLTCLAMMAFCIPG